MTKAKTTLTIKQADKLIDWSIKEVEKHPYIRIGQAFQGVLQEAFPSVLESKKSYDEHGCFDGYFHDTWEIKDFGELIKFVKEHYCDA